MKHDALIIFRIIFAGLFAVTMVAGGYLFKNYGKLFGVDPDMPSENGSARTYRKLMVFAIWAHAVALTAAFALLLD